jgi:divalent metal cation (Fe/Co/Zn/Cd) transporter
LNILWMGVRLLRESMGGLMDEALPAAELERLQACLHAAMAGAIQIHALKTRRAGRLVFAEFHLVVPGEMPVREAHAICDRLEATLQQALPTAVVTIHVEPETQAE